MNLTIPIRAENSNSSLRRYSGSTSADQKRFILSTVVIGVVVGTLVIGGIGSSIMPASAKSDLGYIQVDQQNSQKAPVDAATTMNSSGASSPTPSPATQPSDTAVDTPATPAKSPVVPTTATPAATTPDPITRVQPMTPVAAPMTTPAVSPLTVTPSIVAAPVEVAPVVQPQPVSSPISSTTPTPVTGSLKVVQPTTADIVPSPSVSIDMAASIAGMATVQATTASQPVAYTSSRLSDEARNRIIIMSVVAAVIGGLLYTMSFIGTTPTNPRRDIPIRYIFPVKEAHNY